MATLSQSIQLRDGMSAALTRISANLERVTANFEAMQAAAGDNVPTQAYQQMTAAIEDMRAAVEGTTDQVQQLGQAFQGAVPPANHTLGAVKKIVAAIGSAAAASLSDELTQTTARLNLMNDGMQTTAQLNNMIFASAQRSRGAYMETAAAVSKMGLLAKDAFSSNEETIAFVEQLNKQFAIAGTSQEGQAAAMLQLTQAMGAGVLRGEELNSVFEQAPTIIQTIADYLGVSVGEIREMAQEGELTASVVKGALLSAADETNAKFEQMPMIFAQVWRYFENYAVKAFEPVLQKLNELANSDDFQHLVEDGIGAVVVLSSAVLSVFDAMAGAAGWVKENWDILAPIIAGVAAALLIYHGAIVAVNTVQAIKNGLEALSLARTALQSGASLMAAAALRTQTGAQVGLNTAMLACPITWIVIAIIALIAIIYAAVAAFNHFANQSVSVIGVVVGAIATAGAAIANIIIGLLNFGIGIGVELCNVVISFANFLANVFNDPVGAIIKLFADMFDAILGIIQAAAKAIDTVFGSNLAGALADFRNTVSTKVSDIVGEQVEVIPKLNAADYQLNRIRYSDAWGAGYSLGESLGQKASDFFNLDKIFQDAKNGLDESIYSTIPESSLGDISDTAANTGKMAKSLEITEEDLKYLKDMAERDVINRFTTAEIKLEMTNHNTISSANDIDGIVDYFGERLEEMMVVAAEGGHD